MSAVVVQQEANAVSSTRMTSRSFGRRSDPRAGANATRRLGRGAHFVLALVISIVFAAPIIVAAVQSFEPGSDVAGGAFTAGLAHLTFANYRSVFSGGDGIVRAVINSAVVALVTSLAVMVVATLAGFAFARVRFRGRGVIFALLLVALILPFQGLLAPLDVVLHWLHLLDSLPGLTLIYVTYQLPFAIFIMRNSFAQVPRAIEEAAMVDGASTPTILWSVLRPIVLPGIITVGLYSLLAAWNEFLAAVTFLSTQANFTLPLQLDSLYSGLNGYINYGVLEAGAVVAMVPCLALYAVLQRTYVAGLMAGALQS